MQTAAATSQQAVNAIAQISPNGPFDIILRRRRLTLLFRVLWANSRTDDGDGRGQGQLEYRDGLCNKMIPGSRRPGSVEGLTGRRCEVRRENKNPFLDV